MIALGIWLSLLAISLTLASADRYYEISWRGPIPPQESFTYHEDDVVDIATRINERYRCVIPEDPEHLNFDESARNSSNKISPFAVLEPLFRKSVCSYKFELYWIYELCHGKHLRQYHEAQSRQPTQEFILGKIDAKDISEYFKNQIDDMRGEGGWPRVSVEGDLKPYVILSMTDGTECDLTKQSRVTKVIYVCGDAPNHILHSIKETSTCEYEAIVLSPLLCHHPDFKPDADLQQEISCYSLDSAPKKPQNVFDEKEEDIIRNIQRPGAFLEGRTLVIDADLLFNDHSD